MAYGDGRVPLTIDGHEVPEPLIVRDRQTNEPRVRLVVDGQPLEVPPSMVVFDAESRQFRVRLVSVTFEGENFEVPETMVTIDPVTLQPKPRLMIDGREVPASLIVFDRESNQPKVRLVVDGTQVVVPSSVVVYDPEDRQFKVRQVPALIAGEVVEVAETSAVFDPATGRNRVRLVIDGHEVPASQLIYDRESQQAKIRLIVDGQSVPAAPSMVVFDTVDSRFKFRPVRLTIDGQEVEVPEWSVVLDPASKHSKIMPTTIYDAAVKLGISVPTLCHREYMTPVAVCRVCTVELKGSPRLVPSCQRQVEKGMVVSTHQTSRRVTDAVTTLTELLLSDHPQPCAKHERDGDCELELLANRLGVRTSRFVRSHPDRGHDDTSLVIAVDHNACILCDRCVRGCNEIRNNQVIGRMAKGYATRIAFDLNSPMGDSSCVACGECMVSCPTGALTHRGFVRPTFGERLQPQPEPVPADELSRHPLFEGVSGPFLRWNEGSVVRRHYRKGDIICREGEFGSTAFYIEQGTVDVSLQAPIKHLKSRKDRRRGDRVNWGPFGLLRRFASTLVGRDQDPREEESTTLYIHIDAPVALSYDHPVASLEAGDIFGEMTCMSAYPRSATVRAATDCTVLELLRNMLYILQRSKRSKAMLDDRYRRRAIETHLRSVPIFANLARDEAQFAQLIDFLRPRVELIRANPGEVIFRQGDPADHFYLVRIGFVKVAENHPGGEFVLTYLGPGSYFGEIGLMTHIPEIRAQAPLPVRTATCSALDHVDLVRFSADDFRGVLDQFPQVRQHLIAVAIQRLEENERNRQQVERVPLGDFLSQGLMNANSLLVLDLEKCTRCDECTKACADSHDGVTRLIREGLRFDQFLVASSCRSCFDPYCMVGCPVGSIRRRETREIIIEDWCIGCGLCAENCPYGNINMHPVTAERDDPARPGRTIAVTQRKATTCDLCIGLDGQPSCVYACPHDAAHRMTGRELLDLVKQETGPPL
ncbi:MAG TPA: cyclic nucleotide-binding domain-containing protein [Isosphaeraceae bacterium]|jgi:CRP-like cAMP-binding protein/formate hydrogenlyase subunit 6/NADH:ubiquinone oxidoreductase subunit I|nr:cyclic nucleotide-binding domain-containing protein [Isosphaeraceae bacterium]